MHCPRCQRENRPQAKFCEECGAPLARSCGHCGATLTSSAKFCSECGRAAGVPPEPEARFASPHAYTPKHLAEKILTSKSALEGERKLVTVLFADLKGSEGYIQVRPLGVVPVKGLETPTPVYELTGVVPARSRFQADMEGPTVKRCLHGSGSGSERSSS